ncbi:alpha/beta hydrolase [Lachnobacterium bovis]|uniref:Enterochelin esterase n=1 Tax=Lachnobacterium bovis TaxID=140626 RepID=A0A1H9PYK0_9FIRM|nr:alpha/beta hydrolase-fold protein [Lachnobacterium bovis]SER52663.1 Enterochelin esterase [Lachnobacterium bovis]
MICKKFKNQVKTIVMFLTICFFVSGEFVSCKQIESNNNKNNKINQQSLAKKNNAIKNLKEKIKDAPKTACEVPDEYKKESAQKGKLIKLFYKSKMSNASAIEIDKQATVYIPYGYNKKNKYDVVYLCHGYGANLNTFLGTQDSPRQFKNILDNMIMNKEIKPVIVVTPTYTNKYSNYYDKLDGMTDEIVNYLIPAVEGQYSSYAKNTTPEELIKSRNHRAIGGFSMGGCTTWRAFRRHLDYFKYYMPMSMPIYYYESGYNKPQNDKTAPTLAEAAEKSGYKPNDYAIYAASGDNDFMNEATKQVVEVLKEYPNQFKYTETNFSDGNLMFTTFEGYHRYYFSNPYMYNGLRRFFRE